MMVGRRAFYVRMANFQVLYYYFSMEYIICIYIYRFTLWNCHSESHFNKNGSLIGCFVFGGMIVVVDVAVDNDVNVGFDWR